MKTIYTLSGYNNYFNRIVKREETLQSYLNYPQLTNYHVTENVNFIPHNYINTQQVIGSYDNQFNGCGDYLLVVDNDSGEIDSRWFIISCDMVCEGQYTLNLLRDVLAEYQDSILRNTPTYLEKGYIVDNSSVLNLNKEPDITVNQIKVKETRLRQGQTLSSPYVAMYYTRAKQDTPHMEMKGSIKSNNEYFNETILDTVQEHFSNLKYNKITKQSYTFKCYDDLTSVEYQFNTLDLQDPNSYYYELTGRRKSIFEKKLSIEFTPPFGLQNAVEDFHKEYTKDKTEIVSLSSAYYPIDITSDYEFSTAIKEYGGGKYVKDSTGKIYEVKLVKDTSNDYTINVTSGNLYATFMSILNRTIPPMNIHYQPYDETYQFSITVDNYKYEYVEVQQTDVTYDMTSGNPYITEDAPYNVALIPLNIGTKIHTPDGLLRVAVDGIDVASGIAEQQGSRILDIQIVPYIPSEFIYTDEEDISIVNLTNPRSYSYVKDNIDNNVSVIINLTKSRFTLDLELLDKNTPKLLKGSRKLTNECTKLRLCAPDYSSFFDFNLSQWLQRDKISWFNVDCDYKPLNAYIHVNPDFDGSIYGKDYNDPRGLIYSPKSITLITDQWQQYQVMNKNFEQSFSRQVQNLTVQQKYQRINEMVGATVGTLGGAYSGGLTGSLFGGGKGGLIGGAIGAGASLMGGIADMTINDKLRGEQLSYMKDMHALQLGNIQAQPDTLRTVSALNNNNKLFPVLEFYSCTDEELKMVENKLLLGGMSINVIVTPNDGGISSYINPKKGGLTFIKGRPILIQALKEDYEFCQQINMELVKGVYIQTL